MKVLLTLLTFVSLGYAGICLVVFLLQDRMVFFPQPSNARAVSQLASWHRSIQSPEALISGWVLPARDPEKAPLVFYFGGNAEDVSFTALALRNGADANFIVMNYRGYGGREGVPSESTLFTDALFAYDTLKETTPHNGTIAAIGRSLGSGVAVYLSAQRQIDALILVTPYDSVRNVARRIMPWLPVSLLIRHPFDSLALAPNLSIPALFLVAEHDEVIPLPHTKNLADNWGGDVHWVLVKDATHNSIGEEPDYWSSIRKFLDNQ